MPTRERLLPKQTRMSTRDFVRAFQLGATVLQVAEATGYSRKYVSVRAARLRKEGVRLKRMPTGWSARTECDIRELNKLVAQVKKLTGD